VRFALVNGPDCPNASTRIWIEGPILTVALLCSLALERRVRRRGVSAVILDVSVLLDAGIANSTLLVGVLCPWPSYQGLLRIPDVAIVPVLCLAGGLRLSTRSAILGAACNCLLFTCLLGLDLARNAAIVDFRPSDAQLYLIYFAASSALAVGLATRARALAVSAATETERATRAQSGLASVLQDNHDFGSLLSSASLNADMLARMRGEESSPIAAKVSSALLGDLKNLSLMMIGSREHAYVELTSSEQVEVVTLSTVVLPTISLVTRRFGDLEVELRPERVRGHAAVAGGRRGLERLLLNLLVNAAEGDGRRRATHVSLVLQEVDGKIELSLHDDGPGFPPHVLDASPGRQHSSKPEGAGLGLWLVRRIVEASTGSITFQNTESGGVVRLTLPCGTRVAD
ncbi:MAG: sensor histidine kinase, partial [Myxococcaceae bacterium]|nr:sensor histidine kinase [Myxococcaceae bacterium]